MVYSLSLISVGLTACMFRLELDFPLLLLQIKSVATRRLCYVVHCSVGDIWPTGPMLTLSYIHMLKANALELY